MAKSVKIAALAIMTCIFAACLALFVVSRINKEPDMLDEPESRIVSAELDIEKTNTDTGYDTGLDAAAPDIDSTETVGAQAAQNSPLDDGRYYVLRDADGYLGIFTPEDASRPELITAVRTDSLRNADIERIKIGITVKGFENLLKLLEDYSS